MAELTLQDIRDHVRTFVDVEEEELPDELVDSWVQEGFDLCIVGERRWHFYEVNQTFNTAADIGDYTLTIEAGSPLRDVVAVFGPTYTLNPIPYEAGERVFGWSSSPGEPRFWSVWRERLWLWPIPETVIALDVVGFREPQDWIATGAGAVPDCPSEFHRVIQTWALSRAYLFQEDPELARILEEQFASALQIVRKRSRLADTGTPFIMNQGSPPAILGRLRYDWE
jgi:hypothetical protein